jgi:hypothetical protein
MHRLRSLLLIALGILCLACTPEEDVATTSVPAANGQEFAAEFDATAEPPANNLNPGTRGWRYGEVRVQLSIVQQGSAEVQSAEQGGTRTVLSWRFSLVAQSEQAVWLPQDLTTLLPDYDAPILPRDLLEEVVFEPYSDNAEPTISGTAEYHKQQVIHTPKAADFTSLTEQVDASGQVSRFTLGAINPSRYGRGFETRLDLGFDLKGKRLLSSVGAAGSGHRSEEPCCDPGGLMLQLYPQPDADILPRLRHTEHDAVPVAVIEQQRRIEQDMLALLRELAGNETPRANLHPGLHHRVSKDSLVLQYQVSGARLPALVDLLDVAVAPPSQNELKLTIDIRALP